MIINIDVDPIELTEEIATAFLEGSSSDSGHLIDFIVGLDEEVGDTGFTTELLNKLIKSLKQDLSSDEIQSIVNSALNEE